VKALVPAIVLFGAVAIGLVALRDNVAGSLDAKTAISEPSADAAETRPPVTASQIRTASLRKAGDGHYWATAYVNGEPIKFLVDTGASVVALTERDARKAGLDLDSLPRDAEVRTAGGRVKGGRAVIGKIEIDGVKVEEVQAIVMDEGLEYSLLGMSFFNRLDGWEAKPNAIILRQ
jgi:aspartyl protease family protein